MLRFLRPRVGVALGGGAARGLAHLGALDVLEEAGIVPAAIAGTSIGAMLAGVWAVAGSARAATATVERFVGSEEYLSSRTEFLKVLGGAEPSWAEVLSKKVRRGIVLGWTFFRESFVPMEEYRHNVAHLIPEIDIEQLPVPYTAVATDLISRDSVFFRRGPLRAAVLASGAVPGLMPPVEHDGRFLVDGAVSERVPARALVGDAVDLILGIDVSTDVFESPPLGSGLEIVSRSKQVTEWHLRETRTALCDILLRPEVADIHWLDFSGALPAVERGREAMREALPALIRKLRWAGLARLFGRSRSRQAARAEARGLLGRPPVLLT